MDALITPCALHCVNATRANFVLGADRVGLALLLLALLLMEDPPLSSRHASFRNNHSRDSAVWRAGADQGPGSRRSRRSPRCCTIRREKLRRNATRAGRSDASASADWGPGLLGLFDNMGPSALSVSPWLAGKRKEKKCIPGDDGAWNTMSESCEGEQSDAQAIATHGGAMASFRISCRRPHLLAARGTLRRMWEPCST